MGKFNKTGRSNYSFQFTCDPRQVDELIQNFLMSNNFKPRNKHGDNYYARKGMLSIDAFKYYINGNMVQIQAFCEGVFQDAPLEQSGATVLNGYSAIAIEKYKNMLNPLFAQLENMNIPVANESLNTSAKQEEKIEVLEQEKEQSNEMEKDMKDAEDNDSKTHEENDSIEGGSDMNQDQNGNNQNMNNGMNGGYPNNQNMNNGMNMGYPNNQNMNNGMNMGYPNNQNFNNGMNGGYPNNQNFNNGMNMGYPNGQYFNQNNHNDTLVIVGFVASLFGLFLAFMGYIIGIPLFLFDFYCASLGMNTDKRGFAIATIVISSISIFIVLINIIAVYV